MCVDSEIHNLRIFWKYGFSLGRLEFFFNILGNFLRKVIKNKGKIVLEARNTENFRLRRAKNCIIVLIMIIFRAVRREKKLGYFCVYCVYMHNFEGKVCICTIVYIHI